MTAKLREWASAHLLQLLIYGVALGVAWGSLKAEVGQKADKGEVRAVAEDVRDIKTLICRSYPGDSACLPTPGARR
jgi:hypothetical protein